MISGQLDDRGNVVNAEPIVLAQRIRWGAVEADAASLDGGAIFAAAASDSGMQREKGRGEHCRTSLYR